jgi:hypothetical protein
MNYCALDGVDETQQLQVTEQEAPQEAPQEVPEEEGLGALLDGNPLPAQHSPVSKAMAALMMEYAREGHVIKR